MSTSKHMDRICLIAILLTLLLTLLFLNGKALGITAVADGDTGDGQFTRNDLDGGWDAAGAAQITLTGDGGKVRGNGAYIADGDVHIVYAGRYVLSGELTDGSVIIDADGDDKIWLLLDGVSLHCEDDAALRIEQAAKVFLTLAAGSENSISSGGAYSEAVMASGVDGAVYSRDDLTINGSGALTVTAEYKHGIVCNDDFVITGGTLSVTAPEDGIHAHDSARFANADITINAGDDGVTVSNDEGTGYIYVASGALSIPSCYEGLEAITITIDGGAIDIAPTDDGINANGQGGDSAITINGGDITIVNANGRDADGLDSNGSIYITGGRTFISLSDSGGNSAIDCGSENGGVCTISGGTVIACGSSAMAEGFDPSSEQAFLMYTTTSAAAQTAISLEDADGAVLLSETIPCSFSSLIISTPELRLGDTYTITVGGTAVQVLADNSVQAGGFGMGGGVRGGPGGMGWGQNGRPDMPNGGDDRQRPDGQMPDNRPQGQGEPNGGHFPMTEDRGEPVSPDEGPTVSSSDLALVGLSVLTLLLGLLFAAKTKH